MVYSYWYLQIFFSLGFIPCSFQWIVGHIVSCLSEWLAFSLKKKVLTVFFEDTSPLEWVGTSFNESEQNLYILYCNSQFGDLCWKIIREDFWRGSTPLWVEYFRGSERLHFMVTEPLLFYWIDFHESQSKKLIVLELNTRQVLHARAELLCSSGVGEPH
jgi:hypothetical protein